MEELREQHQSLHEAISSVRRPTRRAVELHPPNPIATEVGNARIAAMLADNHIDALEHAILDGRGEEARVHHDEVRKLLRAAFEHVRVAEESSVARGR